jgi:hypothetical protein
MDAANWNEDTGDDVFGNLQASFGGGQGEKGRVSGTSPAAYPTFCVRPEVACVEWSESSQPSVQGCLQSLSASLVTVGWKARGNVQGSF